MALLLSMLPALAFSRNKPVVRLPLSIAADTSGAKLIAEINLLKSKDPGKYVYADQEGIVIYFKNEHTEYIVPVKWADIEDYSFKGPTTIVFVTDFKAITYHKAAGTGPFYTFKGKKFGLYSKKPTKENFAFADGDNEYLKALYQLVKGVLAIKFPAEEEDDFDF